MSGINFLTTVTSIRLFTFHTSDLHLIIFKSVFHKVKDGSQNWNYDIALSINTLSFLFPYHSMDRNLISVCVLNKNILTHAVHPFCLMGSSVCVCVH